MGLLLIALAPGCGPGADSSARAAGVGPAAVSRLNPRRSNDPHAQAARAALDEGRQALAAQLVRQVRGSLGIEGPLLEARLAALEGRDTDVSRAIEEARRKDSSDARVYATAAELHAAAGRLETAGAEIERGLAAAGACPEMERARGVQLISTAGGAEAGLALLESALRHDPELPFVGRALGQAHLLVGKRRMAKGDLQAGLEHAERSLVFDPEEFDARRFHAECLIASGDLGGAVNVFEGLLADGDDVSVELAMLYKNTGIAALVQARRDEALRCFVRARELGLDDEMLATGANILADEARVLTEEAREVRLAGDHDRSEELALKALEYEPASEEARGELVHCQTERGLAALKAGTYAEAADHLRDALVHDPHSLEARNFLGIALFEISDFAGAEREWSWVVDTARLEKLSLPEPVHINLARAQMRGGKSEGARATLEEYLLLEPGGAFVGATRELLASLDER